MLIQIQSAGAGPEICVSHGAFRRHWCCSSGNHTLCRERENVMWPAVILGLQPSTASQSVLFRPVPPQGRSRETKGRPVWEETGVTGWLARLSTRPCLLSTMVGRERERAWKEWGHMGWGCQLCYFTKFEELWLLLLSSLASSDAQSFSRHEEQTHWRCK